MGFISCKLQHQLPDGWGKAISDMQLIFYSGCKWYSILVAAWGNNNRLNFQISLPHVRLKDKSMVIGQSSKYLGFLSWNKASVDTGIYRLSNIILRLFMKSSVLWQNTCTSHSCLLSLYLLFLQTCSIYHIDHQYI